MSDVQSKGGVQVVTVEPDHSYHLNENALKQILLRDDVKDRPVVVVSVAGSYRGGKSFLLDFFLRYLKSPLSHRSTRDWLGGENEPLKGFSWRGGCDRETTGIHLWSEPILTTLNGEKVVVLLMDTQGTFDSCSTVRDSSTIFALSTLLSSVQIYNIKENIKEDDLQHLHLFTAYGKLARNEDGSAFQVLQFLVRDWAFPYQHAFGVSGGEELLKKRLEINSNQHEELRELREHIRSCFDSVSCFLMPHPGFAVSEQHFDGRLADIREEFKDALMELVPSIFGSENLTLKTIHGSRVKARDLLDHFKIYMRIFNSDELPTPVTLLKATAEAGLLSAEREAREAYEARMESACGAARPSVPQDALRDEHRAALRAAHASFTAKKLMGSQKDIDGHFSRITQELDARLPQYLTLNEAKLQKTITEAKAAYDDTVNNVCMGQLPCLHPNDLESVHRDALTAATNVFDSKRKPHGNAEDCDRTSLLKTLQDNLKDLRVRNEQNNTALVMEAREDYASFMQKLFESGSCVSAETLKRQHKAAADKALNKFNCKRNRSTAHSDDAYLNTLNQNINDHFSKLQMQNRNNNKAAMQSAVYTYNNYMASVWGPQSSCMHPEDLRETHESALRRAVEEFLSSRSPSEDNEGEDADKEKLLDTLRRRYDELHDINEAANRSAVQEAYNEYCRKMDAKCSPSLLSVLVIPWVIKVLALLPKYHEQAFEEALRVFRARRRNNRHHSGDRHLENLKEKLTAGYDEYCNPLKALIREVGLPVPN